MTEAIDITIKLLSPTVANGDINGIAWALYLVIIAMFICGIYETVVRKP